MFFIRLFLFPFSLIYGLISVMRNLLYDWGWIPSYQIPIKSIVVGNLSMGGTGKTPHVDYLVQLLLSKGFHVATLSRGYGRKSKGVLEVSMNAITEEVGDEPLMYKSKHGQQLTVVVAEKRKEGIEYILQQHPQIDVVILDDAFQHRAVKAGFSILLSEYGRMFTQDFLFPMGTLRELRSGKKRADVLVISKCPVLSDSDKANIAVQAQFHGHLFFSSIQYEGVKSILPERKLSEYSENILLVTGIGNAEPLLLELQKKGNVTHLKYADHHAFNAKDIHEIHEKFDSFASRNKMIVTTEKDYMRIQGIPEIQSRANDWYYLPISTRLEEQETFNRLIENYVREN